MLTEYVKDLEQAIRAAYNIGDDAPLFIWADIAVLRGTRMRLDSKAWSALYNDVHEAWLATLPQYHTLGRTILLEPIDQTMDGQAVTVKIGQNGTIGDIKQAFIQMYSVPDILVWSFGECEVANYLSNTQSADADRYQISQPLNIASGFTKSEFLRRAPPVRRGIKLQPRSFQPAKSTTEEIMKGLKPKDMARFNTFRLLVMHYGIGVALTGREARYEVSRLIVATTIWMNSILRI